MYRLLTLCFSICCIGLAQSQEAMRVERCTAINPDSPVFNIHVDNNNRKWISNGEGLFEVHAADLATKVEIPADEESLLSYPGGNADIRWQKGDLNKEIDNVLGGSNVISAAYYNDIQDHLWIGTTETGVFMFRTQPQIKWAKEMKRRMPDFKSEKVNMIYVDAEEDRHFIGTDQGIVMGKGGRWGLEERYYRFEAVTSNGLEVWLLAEDLIWVVDGKDRWRSINVDQENIEGEIKDIAFDRDGRLWIASQLLTVWDVENDTYKIFDGADYFTSNDVNCIAVDKKGAVWVGTQDKGLYLIEKESAMTVTALADKEVSCDPEVNDGSLIVKINGGQPPYSYAWSDGLTGENPKGLAPGSYFLTVTDSQGNSSEAEGVISDTRIKMAIEQNMAATEGQKGGATANVEGGTPKYSYQWDNGEIGPSAQNLEGGRHFVTVTDANGCEAVGSVDITREVGELAVSLERSSISKCAGDGLDQLKAVVRGGLAPYDYKWNTEELVGAEVGGLSAGVFYLTVTDAQGTTSEASVTVPELEPVVMDVRQIGMADEKGENGKAAVKAGGGTGNYTYQWDNGETGTKAENLTAGPHSVTVTDENGCTAEELVAIEQKVGELYVSIEKTKESKCAGDEGHAIAARIGGGTGPYELTWSDPSITAENAEGLKGGIYYVTVTDMNGKTAETSVNIPVLKPLEATAEVNAAASTNEEDGRASVAVTGGSGEYTYAWDNGETVKAATQLAPGVHAVTISDSNGCNTTASVEITENIMALAVDLKITEGVDCQGDGSGAIEATIKGGKGPFTYSWNNPSIEGTQGNGLSGGEYAVTITDAAGNEASGSISIEEPEALSAEVVEQRGVTDESTSDGRAELSVLGGTTPYKYKWDNGYSGAKADNLSFGNHGVTVTDANGCSEVVSFKTDKKILPQLTMSKLKTGQVVQMQMLQFDADSTNLNTTAEPILDEVYQFLKDNPGVVIRVEGHTNNIPPDAFCDQLSTARAKSVAEYVVQQGVAGERVYYRGYGKRQPKYSNLTPEGRKKNQRVEIKILSVNEDG